MKTETIFTIGHSNRSLGAFIAILRRHGVEAVADVRRFPKSRKFPHFNDDSLATTLPEAGMGYVSIPELGGRRKPRPDSVNTAWRVDGFRGYAAFMLTEEFRKALVRLEGITKDKRTAIMCAEAMPWRCHRQLIADALIARGWAVIDIFDQTKSQAHSLPDFAQMKNGVVTYPETDLYAR